ncbi:hypothetical protein DB31_6410 [Hyalangium minutum]|uniref:Uncharacterized protein n=1 Tax=Hyalangium minutum TaxID=394096 RepID=A0A085WP22_9BACT|nr:hypothetical protein DB31_6410 [Hyalangium minutum]
MFAALSKPADAGRVGDSPNHFNNLGRGMASRPALDRISNSKKPSTI